MRHEPRGNAQWRSIALAYAGYVGCTLVGSALGNPMLNVAGAALMTGLLVLRALQIFTIGRDVAWLPLAVMAITIALSAVPDGNSAQFGSIVKLYAVLLLVGIGSAWSLPPLGSVRTRTAIAAILLVVLAISIAIPTEDGGDERIAGRVAGLFVNPNNLALTAMLLLFCLDEDEDSPLIFWGVRIFVLAVILLTKTSGALLGYGVEALLLVLRRLRRWTRLLAVPTLIWMVGLGLVVTDVRLPDIPIPQIQRFQKQIQTVALSKDALLTKGGEINYYSYERELGGGTSSAAWRLFHWRSLLIDFSEGTPWQLLFGRGVGSARERHTLPPHNEYIRVLFELGLVGLLAWLTLWFKLYRRAAPAQRAIFIMVAVYCATENNMDNFLFMSLFALFATATTKARPPDRLAAMTAQSPA
jgi:O-antigen ligase